MSQIIQSIKILITDYTRHPLPKLYLESLMKKRKKEKKNKLDKDLFLNSPFAKSGVGIEPAA